MSSENKRKPTRGQRTCTNPLVNFLHCRSLCCMRFLSGAVHCFFSTQQKQAICFFFPHISNQNFCSKILNCKLLFVELEHMACLHPRVIIVFSTAHSFASYRLRSSTSKVLFLLNLEKKLVC